MTLQVRKMVTSAVFVCALGLQPALGSGGQGPRNTEPGKPEPALRVAEFGETAGKPVKEGFVFIDGRYVSPPYRVARKGLALFVNERMTVPPFACGYEKEWWEPEILAYRREVGREEIEDYLAKNFCCFFFGAQGNMRFQTYVTAYTLPRTVAMLRSSTSDAIKLKRLQKAGWHYSVSTEGLESLLASFSAPRELDERLAALGEELLQIETYGIARGSPIDGSFVFVDGEYVDAPYVVVRKGLGFFIKDRMIDLPIQLPKKFPAGDTDPVLSDDITKNSSVLDGNVGRYVLEKVAYLQKHFDPETERKLMEEVFRGLPFVREARIDSENPNILHVTTFLGESDSLALTRPRRRPKLDPASVLARLEQKHQRHERELERGMGCYYFFSDGGRVRVGGYKAVRKLALAVPLLRSSRPTEEKLVEIREKLGSSQFSDENLVELVANFSASPRLEERLHAIMSEHQDREDGN